MGRIPNFFSPTEESKHSTKIRPPTHSSDEDLTDLTLGKRTHRKKGNKKKKKPKTNPEPPPETTQPALRTIPLINIASHNITSLSEYTTGKAPKVKRAKLVKSLENLAKSHKVICLQECKLNEEDISNLESDFPHFVFLYNNSPQSDKKKKKRT